MHTRWAYKQMRSQPRLPFPGHMRTSSPVVEDFPLSLPDLPTSLLEGTPMERSESYKILSSLVASDPGVLEEYVLNCCRPQTIVKWLTTKTAREEKKFIDRQLVTNSRGDLQSRECSRVNQKENQKTTEQIGSGNYMEALHRVCTELQQITMSTGFCLYGVGNSRDSLYLYTPIGKTPSGCLPKAKGSISPIYPVGPNSSVASYVAHTKQVVVIDDIHMDERFKKASVPQESTAILCLPVLLPSGDLVAIMEFFRTWHGAPYSVETLQSAQSFLHWVTLAIHRTQVSRGLKQQSEMSEFLLEVSRTYLDDITDADHIIQHIMRFAKKLVSADRCSLFLVDKSTGELYSNMFDNGEEKDGSPMFQKQTEIRFSMTKGIAGTVAMTKQVLNIPDAYADTRFNREVDKVTGYTTRSILCIPIMSDDEVYGVVEMINKLGGGAFTSTDQENFKMFAVFCALALRYSKIHTRLRRDQCRYDVVYEQYLYHSQHSEEEVQDLVEYHEPSKVQEIPDDFESFQLCMMDYNEELPVFFLSMVSDLVPSDEVALPTDVRARFVLGVRNNYRDMTYHNWHHAMTVTHSMYCVLQRNLDLFDPVERLTLLVACVGHDLDHRARSNQFLQKTDHPLATLYASSTMENHHLQMTRELLSRTGMDMFIGLSGKEKQRAHNLLRDAIIATDLALHFENRATIEELLNRGDFDFDNPVHRVKAIGLTMTACDISSTAKGWEATKSNVLELYDEFWSEGDQRKDLGLNCLPMMDRDLHEDLPEGQVGFYSNVAVKCFETLARVLPTCDRLAQGARTNLERWRHQAEEHKSMKEERKRELLEEQRRKEQLEREGLGLTLRGGMWMVEDSRTIL